MQSIFLGGTDYSIQDCKEMLNDVNVWISQAKELGKLINATIRELQEADYYQEPEIPLGVQGFLEEVILYCKAIVNDLTIVSNDIETDSINGRTVKLVQTIGFRCASFKESGVDVFRNRPPWHNHDNANFKVFESTYYKTKEFLMSKMESIMLAGRLEDYMIDGKNNITIQGNMVNSQIQQNTSGSSQNMTYNEALDYEGILEVLVRCNESFVKSPDEFGEFKEEVGRLLNEAILLTEGKEAPSKLKTTISKLSSTLKSITTSIIASGICSQISSIPL
ncbi:MAG: hypothetical protein R3Y63_09220 [Eubacteriales bacterium]